MTKVILHTTEAVRSFLSQAVASCSINVTVVKKWGTGFIGRKDLGSVRVITNPYPELRTSISTCLCTQNATVDMSTNSIKHRQILLCTSVWKSLTDI